MGERIARDLVGPYKWVTDRMMLFVSDPANSRKDDVDPSLSEPVWNISSSCIASND